MKTHTHAYAINQRCNHIFGNQAVFKCKSICDLWTFASHTVFYLKNMHVKLSISLVWYSERREKKTEKEWQKKKTCMFNIDVDFKYRKQLGREQCLYRCVWRFNRYYISLLWQLATNRFVYTTFTHSDFEQLKIQPVTDNTYTSAVPFNWQKTQTLFTFRNEIKRRATAVCSLL